MKTITVRKARSMMCPVCSGEMEYNIPPDRRPSMVDEDHTTQSFQCKDKSCGMRFTAWDLVVTGLTKEYEKIYKERLVIMNENQKILVDTEPSCEKCG